MQSPQKIVIIGSAYPLRGGGIATFNERLALEFQQQNYQTTIYSFSLQYPGFLFPGSSQYSNDKPPKNISIKSAINSINPFNWIKVGLELQKQKPDVVIVRYWLPFFGPCFGTILRLIKKNKYSKIICIADNIVPHEKRIGDTIFTRYFIKPVDAFITMSNKVLEDLRLLTNKKSIKVLHPLYDNFGDIVSKEDARKHLKINNTEPIILFFGFIRKYKGLDLLLEAIADLRKDIENVNSPIYNLKLIIAGEFYNDKNFYQNLIEKLKIDQHIISKTDFIPDSEVKYYLCAADFVIQPYKNATQSGVTPLAYHFEKPMLVTNVGGLPDLVPDKKVGLIAEPNAVSIAQKIKELYTFSERHFIENIKEEKKKYSWKNITQTILDLAK